MRIASAEIREPRRQRKIDLRTQIIELHLHPPESGTNVSSYLLPKIADAKRSACKDSEKQADQKDHYDHGNHSLGTSAAPCLVRFLPRSDRSLQEPLPAQRPGQLPKNAIVTAFEYGPRIGALKSKTRQHCWRDRLLSGPGHHRTEGYMCLSTSHPSGIARGRRHLACHWLRTVVA